MRFSVLPLPLVLVTTLGAACAPQLATLSLVNRTPRTITELYVFPAGAADHGASRGALAPNASKDLRIARGNVEVLAISERIRVDATSTETRSASQTVELRGPIQLVFHDSTEPPPGLDRPGTIGVAFRAPPPPPTPPTPPDAPQP